MQFEQKEKHLVFMGSVVAEYRVEDDGVEKSRDQRDLQFGSKS
jgi:hypothetical protein